MFLLNQLQKFFGGYSAGNVPAFQQGSGQVPLVLMQGKDFFLNGVSGDQSIHGYRTLLSDAMRPVRCLMLPRPDSTRDPCG